ncbi:ferredoxin [Ilumatobacter sp.]|uniref:ferredoxin n=1 Tax=Ilumatobacter sp. TaxID=1967498 RepID=UPI003C4133CC
MAEPTTTTGNERPDLVKMAVDSESCIGAGQCEMLAEDVFLISDDEGIAEVLGAGLLDRPTALVAVDRCPGRAISFTEIDAGD